MHQRPIDRIAELLAIIVEGASDEYVEQLRMLLHEQRSTNPERHKALLRGISEFEILWDALECGIHEAQKPLTEEASVLRNVL